jgi:hypothetical protein
MFRPDAKADHSGGDAAKKGESRKQPEGIRRRQWNCTIQYASDDAVLDSELDSLRHLGGPGAAGLHLG